MSGAQFQQTGAAQRRSVAGDRRRARAPGQTGRPEVEDRRRPRVPDKSGQLGPAVHGTVASAGARQQTAVQGEARGDQLEQPVAGAQRAAAVPVGRRLGQLQGPAVGAVRLAQRAKRLRPVRGPVVFRPAPQPPEPHARAAEQLHHGVSGHQRRVQKNPVLGTLFQPQASLGRPIESRRAQGESRRKWRNDRRRRRRRNVFQL